MARRCCIDGLFAMAGMATRLREWILSLKEADTTADTSTPTEPIKEKKDTSTTQNDSGPHMGHGALEVLHYLIDRENRQETMEDDSDSLFDYYLVVFDESDEEDDYGIGEGAGYECCNNCHIFENLYRVYEN